MDPTPFSHDVLAAAETQVARTKSELEAACEEARRIGERKDWLADRPDLARFDRLIKDRPDRLLQFARAQEKYQDNCEIRRQEMTATCPFKAPELEAEIARLRWLHQELNASSSNAHLESLLNDHRLDQSDRAAITARIESNRTRWQSLDTLWSSSRNRVLAVGYSDADWKEYIGLISERLQRLEQESCDLHSLHEHKLHSEIEKELIPLKARIDNAAKALSEANVALPHKSEIEQYIASCIEAFIAEQTLDKQAAHNAAIWAFEEAQREARRIDQEQKREAHRIREEQLRVWWEAVAKHPIASVVEKLPNVPDAHIETVLDRLLKIDSTDPHIHNEEVHRFLEHKHQRLVRRPGVTAPVVVAYIGDLVAKTNDARARELLNLFPIDDRSALAGVVSYLRYVIGETPELAGVTYYRNLSAEDLFLGACYYGEREAAWPILKKQSQWDYKSLTGALLTNGEGRALNDFKVRGLQPRIAELAFHHLYGQLHGDDAQHKLCDLNVEYVKGITGPWRLPQLDLPHYDWSDVEGKKYDVKCNVFYSTKKEKDGLRGFLIKRSSDSTHAFPGFVFTDKNDESCRWIYVGEYRRIKNMEQAGDRIIPFCFRLPDSTRFIPVIKKCDFDLGLRLLKDDWLRIGWQLAAQLADVPNQEQHTPSESSFDEFIDRCLQECRDTFLEYALWKSLTKTTLDACSRYGPDAVGAFLKRADQLLKSRALPIRLPQIDGKPILERWIDEVLKPLSENWGQIRCINCRRSATEPGMIQLQITRVTSEGTIYGRMTCNHCGHTREKATLLTHCYKKKCGHYPLIIGMNPVCIACGGLVCDWQNGGTRCKCCKPGQQGKPNCEMGQQTSEADFVENRESKPKRKPDPNF